MKKIQLITWALIVMAIFRSSITEAGNIPAASQFQSYPLNSGEYNGKPSGTFVAYKGKVQISGASWLRLYFSKVSLSLKSYIVITSLKDTAQQHLNATTIAQWKNTSAYFNGGAVEIALYVAPGDSGVSFDLEKVLVGQHTLQAQEMDNIATISDNRVPSSDPAVGRLHDYYDGNEATAWIAANGYLVTAGHISGRWSYDGQNGEIAYQILEFNVPNSQSNGTMNPSNPKDQYAISSWSTTFVEFNTTTTGEDWAFFTVYPNSETELLPLQAQQKYYDPEQNDTATSLAVTGYGNDSGTLNNTQQTATGSDAGSSGELLKYSVYITNGSSGSPVIDESTQKVVGIVDDFDGSYNVGTSMFNTSLWSAMQPITFNNSVVTQFLSDNVTTDPNLGRWNGSSFGSISPGAPINVTTGSPEVFKGDQTVYNGQKYNNWTLNGGLDYDVINPHKFLMLGTNFTSHLNPVYNAGITSYLSELNSSVFAVSFIDPWFIDYNDPTYGMRNLGMIRATPNSVPISTYNLGTTTSYKGVFLNQVPLVNNPNSPYYSVSAPSTQPYNNYTWVFYNWSGTNGTYFQNASATTTPVVFGGSGSVITANYKGVHLSSDPAAFANNSQKKLVRTPNGTNGFLHQVYTSLGHVWYEYSADNGVTWQLGNNGLPLDGTNGGKCPSIDRETQHNNVIVVWQEQSGQNYIIKYMTFLPTSNTTYGVNTGPFPIFNENVDLYSSTNANPNIVISLANYWALTIERKANDNTAGHIVSQGINTWGVGQSFDGYVLNGLQWQGQNILPTQVPWTDANSINATISSSKVQGTSGLFDLAWEEYASGTQSSIYWCSLQPNVGSNGYLILLPVVIPPNLSSYTNVSSYANYAYNTLPSIISLPNGTARVSWIGDVNGLGTSVQAVMSIPSYPSLLMEAGSKVHSVSMNLLDDGSKCYVAYSQNTLRSYWSDMARSSADNFGSTQPIGAGEYVQLSNGTTSSSVYASCYYPFSVPYYFQSSPSLGSTGLGKTATEQSAYGRGDVVVEDSLRFYYIFENLTVDNNSINFVDAPDTVNYNNLDTLNKVLVTQPFSITDKSSFSFNENCGFVDSVAALKVLGNKGFIGYKVELLDNGTGKALGTIKNTTFNSSNVHGDSFVPYLLNTKGIGSRTVKARITMSTNIEKPKFTLIISYPNTDLIDGLQKSSVNELALTELNVVADYALEQNYPNPFNPATTISYQIPKDGQVTIKIFDALGRKVSTLVDEFKPSGQYTVKFDASHLSSGIYFYSIKSGDYTAVKKMALIK